MNQDLVRLIAWRVLAGDLQDYVRFRAVCRHWRSSTDSPRGRGVVDPRFHPRRWMMFPEGHGLNPSHTKLRDYIRFLNLDTGRFVRAKLPFFKDHCVLDSVDGLLVMHRDEDTPLSFQGKLYMARMSFDHKENSDIFQVDPPPPQDHDHVDVVGSAGSSSLTLPPPKLVATIPAEKLTRPTHLVECDSRILVTGYTDRSWSHMIIHRLADLITSENPTPVTSIGEKALFLDNVRSLSVSSNGALPTLVSSTIVQASLANGSLTEYNLSTDAWSRPMDGCILRGPVFGPYCLIYHIYTCCIRE